MFNKGTLIEISAKLPQVVHRILLYSEFAQPMYLMATYWTSVLPENIWSNEMFLDNASEFIQDASHSQDILTSPRRHLLQALQPIPQDIPNLHKRTLLQSSTVIKTDVPSSTVYEWSQSPYSSPPNYVFWSGDQSCTVVSTAINVVEMG